MSMVLLYCLVSECRNERLLKQSKNNSFYFSRFSIIYSDMAWNFREQILK